MGLYTGLAVEAALSTHTMGRDVGQKDRSLVLLPAFWTEASVLACVGLYSGDTKGEDTNE